MSKTKDNFETGYFWEYYMDLERQFIEFMNYVPYLKGNENIYSFRLANLVLAIGAHIDSAFKEMAKYSEIKAKYPPLPRRPTMFHYHFLVEEYELANRRVKFKGLPKRENLRPFERFYKYEDKKGKEKLNCPEWWNVYNGVKHEFSDNFKDANFMNTRDALAGAFLLNVVHKPAIIRLYEYGVAKYKYRRYIAEYDTEVATSLGEIRDMVKGTIYPSIVVETNLFIFNGEKPKANDH
jgi:hypothetical protein